MEKQKTFQFYALSSADSPDDFRYIGVTSNSIPSRFSQHKYCATHPEKCGLPVHKWMSSVYKTGGKIIHTKIDECGEKEWEDREVYLIQKYKNLGYKLLNLDKGGKGVITAEKRTLSSLQRSAKAHEKSIVLFDKLGNLVEICPSLIYAHKKYGLNRTSIGNVLHSRSKTCGGYYIIDAKDYSETFDIKQFINEKNKETIKQKTVYQFDLQGNLITYYKSLNDIAKQYHYGINALNKAIKNKTEFKESYWANTCAIEVSEYKNSYKYYHKGKYYKTQKEIGIDNNLASCTISNYIINNYPLNGETIQVL